MFITTEEKEISGDFIKNGYIKKKVDNTDSLIFISNTLKKIILNFSKLKHINASNDKILENIHNYIEYEDLNNFRIYCINEISKNYEVKVAYYKIFKKYADIIIGNELAMQKKINLSIQIPHDKSSILNIHADTWSGDSAFETVCWLPMVDCLNSMCMFILPEYNYPFFEKKYAETKNKNSDDLYDSLKKYLKWVDIKFGEVLIFNQNLPHGNIVNVEKNTRWSFNCRFKGIFTPYKDKKIGEFFEPITLRASSKIGLKYKFPQ